MSPSLRANLPAATLPLIPCAFLLPHCPRPKWPKEEEARLFSFLNPDPAVTATCGRRWEGADCSAGCPWPGGWGMKTVWPWSLTLTRQHTKSEVGPPH